MDRHGLIGRGRPTYQNSAAPASLPHMDLPSDLPSPQKPKLTAEERRARDADRVATIRLRMMIGRALEDRGITTPAEIAETLVMSPAEATKMMTGRRWRPDTVALLEAAAARLGLQVPG